MTYKDKNPTLTEQIDEDLARQFYLKDILKENRQDREEIKRLWTFVDWVDSWVSNDVASYSTDALNGLFMLTLDKIQHLKKH